MLPGRMSPEPRTAAPGEAEFGEKFLENWVFILKFRRGMEVEQSRSATTMLSSSSRDSFIIEVILF